MRLVVAALGFAAILWSCAALPPFWLTLPARQAAERIVADQRFRPGVLRQLLVRLANAPQPKPLPAAFARADALISLRAAESQWRAQDDADRETDVAYQKIRSALSVLPGDPLLWLLLYSVDMARNGFHAEIVDYLDRSYAEGPNEGWIALRRNRLALAIFSSLRAETQNLVIAEFAKMVDADWIDHAALNLLGTGWQQRDRLVSALGEVNISSKKSLYNQISGSGVRLNIPGLDYDVRPWR